MSKLSPSEILLLEALTRTGERSRSQIIDALYGMRPDGGPNDPDNTTKVFMHRLRSKLKAYGIFIHSAPRAAGSGYFMQLGDRKRAKKLLSNIGKFQAGLLKPSDLDDVGCCPHCGRAWDVESKQLSLIGAAE